MEKLATAAPEPTREFVLDDRDFQFLARLIREQAGIVISDAKRQMVYSRITRRLRELRYASFADYCHLLQDKQQGQAEMEHFINALTTNLTAFFRESHHFDYLRDTVLADLIKTKQDKKLRIWSAGCSSGEEPYSIAITVAETLPRDWDVRILATELDSRILAEAEAGIYAMDKVKKLSNAWLKRWFQRGTGNREGYVRVASALRDMITFKRLNLLHPWPFQGGFDVIFCRNVVIYFDKETQTRLFDRYADVLQPQGHLFIGHSESLYKKSERFTPLGGTIYRKLH